MALQYDITIENTSGTEQSVEMFGANERTTKKTNKYQVSIAYKASYPVGTNVILVDGGQTYDIFTTEILDGSGLVDLLNDTGAGTFSLNSDGPTYTVIDVISDLEFSVIEILITPPEIVSLTTNSGGTDIEITFDKNMSDPTGKEGQFSYSINGLSGISFSAAALKGGDDTTIVLTGSVPIVYVDVVTVSYEKGTVQSTDDGLLDSFSDESVVNAVPDVVFLTIGTGFDNYPEDIKVQSDGKILIAGRFTDYNGNTINRIIRLNTDGSVDTSFTSGTGFNSYVSAIAIQSDGKILAGGGFTSYNGTLINHIVRINTDGTIDGTFSVGSGFNGDVYAISIQTDGKIVVGGGFTSYDGNTRNRIIRLNTDGSIDNTVTLGTWFNNIVNVIKIQTDGKIVVGGRFTSFSGTAINRIIRLNTDLSIDGTFSIGSGFNAFVYGLDIQTDGKIVAVGLFTTYNGTASARIARINTNGSIDGTFVLGTGLDNTCEVIFVQSDGKILSGGAFTSYNGTSINRIVRINTDGTIDGTFSVGSGFNNDVYVITEQDDNKLLIGGLFTTYNSNSRRRITRLNSDGTDNTTN